MSTADPIPPHRRPMPGPTRPGAPASCAPGVEWLNLPVRSDFWDAAARAVLQRAGAWGIAAPALQAITWLVPQGAHAVLARAALWRASGGGALRPPRIAPLAAWLDVAPRAGLAAQIEIHGALRGSEWVRRTFGARPPALWALARSVAALCDELDRAAVDAPEALAERLEACLRRHYQRRAQRAVEAPAKLVLAIWVARRSAADGAAAGLRALAQRADCCAGPLVLLGTAAPAQPLAAWELAFAARWAERWPVLCIVPNVGGAAQPWAAAAWPELQTAAPGGAQPPAAPPLPPAAPPLPPAAPSLPPAASSLPLAAAPPAPPTAVPPSMAATAPPTAPAGADHPPLAAPPAAAPAMPLPAAAAAPVALRVLAAASLEDEAAAVCAQTLEWLRVGVVDIALVVLDRLTARRARALLERAQVRVRDETGWTLATTSAAGAVMRWLDLVGHDADWRDLLDWLKSPFALDGWPQRTAAVEVIERALREAPSAPDGAALRGVVVAWLADERTRWQRRGGAAAAEALAALQPAVEAALGVLDAIEDQRRPARRRAALAQHAQQLAAALAALGMHAPLARDPVGRSVLDELAAVAAAAAGRADTYSPAEYRALLASRFEQVAHAERAVDSPVVFLTLAAAALRPAQAALLVGADAEHLPTSGDDGLFLPAAVRGELGLATAAAARDGQARCLAALLASVPRAAATWRQARGDEPLALSPLLERLRTACPAAVRVEPAQRSRFAVSAALPVRPAPAAGSLLPQRLSAAAVQDLVTCPYQFFARHLLGLEPLDEPRDDADKRDFGSAVHGILHAFHAEWGSADLSIVDRQRLADSLAAHAASEFGRLQDCWPEALTFRHLFAALLPDYLDATLADAREGWRWQVGEQRVQASLALADGRSVELVGRVDRVDRHAHDGRCRVIDYKLRPRHSLQAALREAGADVQLPLYGLLLGAAAAEARYLALDIAGPAQRGEAAVRVRAVEPPQDYPALVAAVAARTRADLARIVADAPLPAHGAAADCARCAVRGLCRRGAWRDDEPPLPGVVAASEAGT